MRLALVALIALAACASVRVRAVAGGNDVSCSREIYPCMVEANKLCTKGFTMIPNHGSLSGPSMADWRPGPDGWFHLLVTCNEEPTKP